MQKKVLLSCLFMLLPFENWGILFPSFETLIIVFQSFFVTSGIIVTLSITIAMACGSVLAGYFKQGLKSQKSLAGLVSMIVAFVTLMALWRAKAYKFIAPFRVYMSKRVWKNFGAIINRLCKYLILICGVVFAISFIFTLLEKDTLVNKSKSLTPLRS
jgi:hypothetical protein